MNKLCNKNKEKEKIRKIGKSPLQHLGYFPFKGVFGGLGVKKYIDFLGCSRMIYAVVAHYERWRP